MFGLTSSQVGGTGLGFEGLGFAEQAVGAYMNYQAQKGAYQSESNIAQLEMQSNKLAENQMEINGRRSQMEVLRNEQRARSLALSTAAGQGAQFGSGLQGGYGQIGGASGNNMLGINQNLSLGRQQATINDQITQQKLALGKYQSSASTASGLTSLGSSIQGFGGNLVNVATNPSGSLFTS